jgi:hypothetical protein
MAKDLESQDRIRERAQRRLQEFGRRRVLARLPHLSQAQVAYLAQHPEAMDELIAAVGNPEIVDAMMGGDG